MYVYPYIHTGTYQWLYVGGTSREGHGQVEPHPATRGDCLFRMIEVGKRKDVAGLQSDEIRMARAMGIVMVGHATTYP